MFVTVVLLKHDGDARALRCRHTLVLVSLCCRHTLVIVSLRLLPSVEVVACFCGACLVAQVPWLAVQRRGCLHPHSSGGCLSDRAPERMIEGVVVALFELSVLLAMDKVCDVGCTAVHYMSH